jgi:hypothetical protein
MEILAHAFDQPIDSPEHQDLAATAWMGGEGISVRYWLGRLLRHNFFRESDDTVKVALKKYFTEAGCEKGSQLVADYQSWSALTIHLKHKVEIGENSRPTTTPKLVTALQAVMADPERTDVELAVVAKTTEKQIRRMTEITVLRKLWRLQSA